MLENIPSQSIMTELLGQSLYEVWQALCSTIDERYDMEQLWNTLSIVVCRRITKLKNKSEFGGIKIWLIRIRS